MVISHNGDNYSHYIKWWFHGIYPLLMVNIWTVETSYLQTMFHRSSHLGDLLLFLPQNSRGAGSWFFSHRRGLFFQPTNGNLGHIIYIIIYIYDIILDRPKMIPKCISCCLWTMKNTSIHRYQPEKRGHWKMVTWPTKPRTFCEESSKDVDELSDKLSDWK